MTPLSRWKLTQEDENGVIQVLINQLMTVKSEEDMGLFIEVILTKTERLVIGKRIFAFVLINQGLTDMDIARKLHFTRATVERLRNTFEHLHETNKPVKQLVKHFETSEVLKDLLNKFLHYAASAAFGRIPLKKLY